jgi:hypothetical protein
MKQYKKAVLIENFVIKLGNLSHLRKIILTALHFLLIFQKLSIWISCFRVLFGCNSTFEHPAYLNSGKNYVEAYIY